MLPAAELAASLTRDDHGPRLAPPRDQLIDAVARLVAERDSLDRRVHILDAKLIEVTDLLENGTAVREAYRRGYYAGHKAKRRGRPADLRERRSRVEFEAEVA